MQTRSSEPERRVSRRRPIIGALLSFAWPGLGQAYHGRRSQGLAHALPPALAVLALAALVLFIGPLIFGLHLLNPIVSLGLVVLIAVLAVWRGFSIVDAARPRTAAANGVVVALLAVVVLSHAWLANNALAFYEAGQRISQPVDVGQQPTPPPGRESTPSPTSVPAASQAATPSISAPVTSPTPRPLPGANRRVTVLLVGVDNTHTVERGLTDTLIVASFDPVDHSLTMISIPRDTARLPYYAGGEFRPRVNNLMQTAARNPDQYPDGPMGTLVNEVSYLVGVPIHYYAMIDISGFTALVDMVGGVDIVADKPINDPTYQFTPTEVGFFLEAGPHHLDGKLATAYARSRHGPGNNDYERARRQQQMLVALRSELNDPRLMTNLPGVLWVLSNIIRTDAPLDRLPDIVSIALASADAHPQHYVLAPPRYAERARNEAGDLTFATQLKMDAVAELSIELFGEESRYAGP